MNDKVVLQAFTELAPRYEDTIDREVREFCGLGYRELIHRLVDHVPVIEGQKILDIASGTAVSSVEIAMRIGTDSQVVGLDITPAMMAYGAGNIAAAGLGSRVHQVCGSGVEMPLGADSFDVVICGLGTHHMDVRRLLSEIRRVLRSEGHLIVADVGAPAPWRTLWGRVLVWTMIRLIRTFWRSARVEAEADAIPSIRTAGEWRDLLIRFGFDSVEIEERPARRFFYPCVLILRAIIQKD